MELLLAPLFVALLLAVLPKQFARLAGIIGTLVILGITIGHVVAFSPNNVVSIFDPNASTKFGLTFKMGYDGIGLFMVILTNALIPVILLSNFNRSIAHEKSFNAMVLFMQFTMTGLYLAMDGIVFYVFWEMTLIPIFLILLWFGAPERKVILTKFFVYTFIGSLGMLLSLIALSRLTDDFSYESLLAIKLVPKSAFWIMSGFFLAFAIKIPVFPFHTWQPDTYTIAPVAGTMLLSALMLNMALYGMVKWMIPIAPEALTEMKFLIITLGIIGVVYAGVIAIKQQDIKRVFAYASISHVGLIAAGIMLFNTEALSAVFLQIANHSLVAIGLFLAAGILENRLNTRDLSQMGGIAKVAPKFAFWFAVTAFASMAVPFTSGFIGEFLLLKGLFSYHWLVGILAGSTLVFGAIYTLRAYQLSMYGAPKDSSFEDIKWNELVAFALLSVVIIMLGIFPQIVFDFVGPSLDKIVTTIQTSKIQIR